MKQLMRKILAATTILSLLMANTLCVSATEEKSGTGDYIIKVHNAATTGIDITGDWFHAYQIFAASDVTSYDVTPEFEAFFSGKNMVAGDGSGDTFDFQSQLDIIYDAESTEDEIDTATTKYNQLAGLYMNTYQNNMYTMAEQFRTYLDAYGNYSNPDLDGAIHCTAHSQAVKNEDGSQTATLSGVDTGYYFIFDQESTLAGLGIAASGAFVPLTDDSPTVTTVEVKDSVPTMTKQIYHDDSNIWDVVGDHQIGDTVEFLITSTLPSNITDYIKSDDDSNDYIYILTDTMSAGITYNNNVTVYTDFAQTNPVDTAYLTIDNAPAASADGTPTFTVTVDVEGLMTDSRYDTVMTLYLYYTGTLNEQAVVANDYDTNTVTLEYSNNPADLSQTGDTESTVFHYTFALNVNKIDENGDGLAGARFAILDENGLAIPLSQGETDYSTGVVSYYYDASATPVSDGGYITTEAVELLEDGVPTGVTVTGKFQVYGLNDQVIYTLKEVEAPDGYNTADQFDFIFSVNYDTTGTEITYLADGSSYINTAKDSNGDWASETTIINMLKIYLPSTGGMGTVLFQVGGGLLMLGAVAMLVIGKHKKEAK